MTEWLHFHFPLSCIGEGNGNPLQCSCLENPRNGGAWWAAICGVAQSQTRLKRLSSSSSHSVVFNSLWPHRLYVACQAPLSMEFSRQEYRSGLPFPPPGDLPDKGMEPATTIWQADSLPLSHQRSLLLGAGIFWTLRKEKVKGEKENENQEGWDKF